MINTSLVFLARLWRHDGRARIWHFKYGRGLLIAVGSCGAEAAVLRAIEAAAGPC